MKTENIFDMLENESTISESTVTENTGVSTERVLDMVKQEIGSTGKVIKFGKKRSKVLKITALVAAVLTASVLTASALDGFNSAFGSLFAGDSPDGLYSGGDLSIESEKTNVEFLGIAGDDYVVAAAMKLRNDDDTPYVDSIEDTWIDASTSDSTDDYDCFMFPALPDTIRFTTPGWFKFKYPNAINAAGQRDDYLRTFGFYFEDESTISAYIYASSGCGALRGETMTASANNLSAYTVKEIVYDYSEHLEENIDEYGSMFNEDFHKALTKWLQEFGTGEKNGVRVMIHPETNDIVLAHETPLNVNFSLSVKMNYKNSSVKLKMKDLDKCFEKWSAGASGSAVVTPFNVMLSVKLTEAMSNTYDQAIDDIPGWEGFEAYLAATATNPEFLTVTLEDGTTLTAYDQGMTEDTYMNDSEFTVIYQFFNDNGDGSRSHPIAIDPKKIVSIEAKDTVSIDANGTVIYEK